MTFAIVGAGCAAIALVCHAPDHWRALVVNREGFLDVVIESWGERGARTIFVIEQDGRSHRHEGTRTDFNSSYELRGNIADAVEAFLVALTRATDPPRSGRAVAIHNDIRAAAFPAQPIHRLCPACGERQPGAECQSPACRQIRRCVAARKTEEATRAAYVRFDAVVRDTVLRLSPDASIVTDSIGAGTFVAAGAIHTRAQLFVAVIEVAGVRRPFSVDITASPTQIAGRAADHWRSIRDELGAKAMGAKR